MLLSFAAPRACAALRMCILRVLWLCWESLCHNWHASCLLHASACPHPLCALPPPPPPTICLQYQRPKDLQNFAWAAKFEFQDKLKRQDEEKAQRQALNKEERARRKSEVGGRLALAAAAGLCSACSPHCWVVLERSKMDASTQQAGKLALSFAGRFDASSGASFS